MSITTHTGLGERNPTGSDAVTANQVRSRFAVAQNKEKSLLSGRFPSWQSWRALLIILV